MNAVIASAASRRSKVRLGCWPIAIRTIIVSPTAREILANDATIRRRLRGRRSGWRPAPWSSRARRRRRGGRAWHRAHRVVGERRDDRHQHHAHHEPGGEGVEDVHLDPEVAQQSGHEREREVAEDDRRDPGEGLERGLQNPPGPRRRVLAQVDRRTEAEQHRNEARDQGDEQGARDEREHAEVGGLEQRRPLRPGEEVDDRDLAEELERRQERARRRCPRSSPPRSARRGRARP